MPQFIFTMKDLRKVTPQGKEILKGIWLSFYPGAKIGVLGAQRRRQAHAAADHGRRRQGLRRRGVPGRGHTRRLPAAGAAARPDEERAAATSRRRSPRRAQLLARFDEICAARRGLTPTRWRSCSTSRRALQDQIDAAERCGSSTARSRSRWTRCACRRATPTSTTLSGGERRRVALCRLLLQHARPAAARRADEPPRRRVGGLARALPAGVPGHASSPSRTTATSSTTWPAGSSSSTAARGIPWEGNYSSWLEQKQQRLTQEEKEDSARQRTLERELEWVRMAPRARQAKSKARLAAYEELLAEEQAAEKRDDELEIAIPPGPRLGDVVIEAEKPAQGLRRPPADRGPRLHAAARRHRRRHRPQRRRQDDALPHDHRARRSPTPARCASARRWSSPTSTRAATRSTRERTASGRRSRRRQGPRSMVGKREVNSRAYAAVVQLPGPRPAEEGEGPLGRRAQPRAPGQAAARAAATCCCSTSRPTTSTSTRCARSRRRCSTSPAARS